MKKSFIYPKNKTEHSGEVIDSKDGFDVIECLACFFKHVIPIPSHEELEEFYGREFYSHVKPKYFAHYEEDLDWWMATYRNHYELLAKHTKGRRLLDIGSGPGHFLKCGKELGWEVLGFEPSKDAAEYSRKLGVEVVNDFFSKESIKKYGKFDVIYMKTVIEHLPDPKELLQMAKDSLAPGGLLCVISPNEYNPLQNILRKNLNYNPWWVAPPQHINYFNSESITNLLTKLDFKVVESLGNFPMEIFLLSGHNYIGNEKVGRECQANRKLFEQNMYKYGNDYLNSVYSYFAKIGIGREFIVIAKI